MNRIKIDKGNAHVGIENYRMKFMLLRDLRILEYVFEV